jgi:hypothetical protein
MKEIIEVLRGFTAQQLAVIITIIGACFSGFFWVEHRYANLKTTEENIERMLNNIIQIDSKLTAMISQYPEETIKKIDATAKKQEEAIRNYVAKKNNP